MSCDSLQQDGEASMSVDVGNDLAEDGVGSVTLPRPRIPRSPGPSTLDEIYGWPSFFLTRLHSLRPECIQLLLQKVKTGVNLFTDWSGMGCPEQSFSMLREGLEQLNMLTADAPDFLKCVRACDTLPLARKALLAFSAGGPCHVFENIMDRVPANVQDQLKKLTAVAQEKLAKAPLAPGQKVNPKAREQLGEQLVRDMCDMLGTVQWHEAQTQLCHRHHGQCCPIWGGPEDRFDGGFSMAIVGNECLDWTSFGKQAGECGDGLMVLLAWCFEMLALGVPCIIEECTPLFKLWILEYVFVTCTQGRYEMQSRVFSPTDLGIPASRPRQYAIITATSVISCVLPFASEEFEDMFFRDMQLTGSIFFNRIGGPVERKQFKLHLMEQRGLMLRNQSIASVAWADVLSAGNRMRLKGFIKLAKKKFGFPQGIVDVMQNSSYSSGLPSVVPTLRRKGTVMDLSSMRPLLPAAHFDVMGIPLHGSEHCSHHSPLARFVPTLSFSQMQELCGNAMHLSAVGLCITYCLACTQPR